MSHCRGNTVKMLPNLFQVGQTESARMGTQWSWPNTRSWHLVMKTGSTPEQVRERTFIRGITAVCKFVTQLMVWACSLFRSRYYSSSIHLTVLEDSHTKSLDSPRHCQMMNPVKLASKHNTCHGLGQVWANRQCPCHDQKSMEVGTGTVCARPISVWAQGTWHAKSCKHSRALR